MSVLLGQARPTACRWIMGATLGAATEICGRKVKGHSSWCTRHYKKVFHCGQGAARTKFSGYAKTVGWYSRRG